MDSAFWGNSMNKINPRPAGPPTVPLPACGGTGWGVEIEQHTIAMLLFVEEKEKT